MSRVLRSLGYLWALPVSLIGLLLAAVYGARAVRWHRGCLEFQARWIFPWWQPIGGQTWGWVIFYSRDWGRPHTQCHERWHTRQAMALGPLWLVLYPLSSLAALVTGDHYYFGNQFEVHADRMADRGIWPW